MSGGSRVTEAMLEAAHEAYEREARVTAFNIPLRDAIEAALSHQAPAVAVSELEALDRWDVFAECGHNGSGYVERQVYDDGEFIRHDDLRTLINKAGSDE